MSDRPRRRAGSGAAALGIIRRRHSFDPEPPKKRVILVSACLLGEPCRYDGRSKPCREVIALGQRYTLVPVCPEQAGGLPTPREPSEIQPGGGVRSVSGRNVSFEYMRGASVCLRTMRESGALLAVLKARSPACGSGAVYDGSFSGTLTEGDGIFAGLLKKRGFPVLTEEEIDSIGPIRPPGGRHEDGDQAEGAGTDEV
jgi:uncharacterized protein YbbK (DUF523 family)